MSYTLYDACVPTFQQMVGSTHAFLIKAKDWAAEQGLDETELMQTRLAEDMFALDFQIALVEHFSYGVIEGVRAGSFSPPQKPMPKSFDEAIALLADALANLETVDRAEVDGWIGRPMQFVAGEMKLPFTTENFVSSFAIPSLCFHATTAYDLLRMKGAPLGKRDYLGAVRINQD